MRRPGLVHVVVVSSFVLAVGSIAAEGSTQARSVSASAPRGLAPVPARQQGRPVPPAAPAPGQPDAGVRPDPATGSGPGSSGSREPAAVPNRPVSYVRQPRPANAIALTIDDGPHPVWTPKMLDLLAKYGVHATFCLIGEQVPANAALVRRMVAEGHTLCDHTWDHDEKLPSRSPDVVHREVRTTYDAIVAASGGVAPVYYRAPGGNWGGQVTTEAGALGMTSLNWSVDPVDWSRPGTAKIISTVLGNTRPGDVILVHDGGGNRQQTLDALDVILPDLIARGYTFVAP